MPDYKEYKTNVDLITLKKQKADFKRAKIGSSKDAADFARNFYFEDLTIFESFFVIVLNNSNNTIGYVKISQGGVTGTLVDSKIIAKIALDSLATAIIMVHNHPSGTLRPSQEDENITQKIKNGLNFFDIKLLDHIILTETAYYSFADQSIL